MITGRFWQLQDDAALRAIEAAAVRLLEKGGVHVHHEGLLDRLEGAGCRADRAESRCYIPEPLLRETLAHLGGATDEDVSIPSGWNPQNRLGHGGSYPHLLEWPSGQRRLATRRDVADMAKMAHTLDEFTHVGKVLTCCEVDQRVEPLWAALRLAQITDKPIGGGEIFHADYIEPLVRMGEVLSGRPGDDRLVASCDFFIAPLIFDRRQAECFLEKRRLGIGNVPGTMPVSGMSAPVTIAGAAAVAVAELMAGWVFGYVVDPALPARGIVSTGSLDMRSATARFGSPEALLQDFTVVQLCRRLYGIPVWAAVSYVDAKRPGLEAVFEKMLPLVGIPFGADFAPGGGGLLSAGQDYSPVQHLLDAEMGQAVARFRGTCEVSDDTLAVELIEEMMRRGATNFLDTDHTLRHYRAEQWYPRWFDRSPYQGPDAEVEAERRMLERVGAYARDAIARYEPPDLDQARLRELRCIFLSAEKAILGANITLLERP